MYKTVFILGAGASADAGVPIMSSFLSKAEDLFNSAGLHVDEKNAFNAVFDAIHRLKGVSYQIRNNLNNIENVFGLLDMGRMLGKLGDVAPDKICQLFLDIQKVIGLTIDFNTAIKRRKENDFVLDGPTHRFVSLIKDAFFIIDSFETAIITFNYDLTLEYAMHYYNIMPNYFIDDISFPSRLPLLKLHGSLNWAADADGKLFDWEMGDIFNRIDFNNRVNRHRLIVARELFNNKSPFNFETSGPFLVPPTWNKAEYHLKIGRVWQKAVDFLADAQAIYVIGYSMPETDIFFRHLLSLATYSRTNIRRFWVFDPLPEVGRRFDKIVGDGLRDAFDYQQMDFTGAIDHIVKENLD